MKNKFLCVFFAVTALLLCFVFSANASLGLTDDEILELEEVEDYNECYASGDVDGNGSIDSDDARFILRLAVNLEKIDMSFFMKADVDGDGKITAADAREALRLAVGLDDAPAHTIEEVVVVPATCATDGLTVKVCTSCVKLYAKVTLPATTDKHITGFWETVKAPDCSGKGLAQLKCLVCDTVVKETELSPTNRHSGEWTYPDGKDCFNPVSKTRTCTVCGTVENKVENPQGGHTLKWVAKVDKTCTEDGIQVNKCTNCGFEKEEAPLPATGHIFEYETVVKEPTCEETGLSAKKCVKCDHTEDEYATPALGHDYDNNRYKVTKEPTCAEEGAADVVCSRCGDAKKIALDKIPHTLTGKWTETLAPTCTEEGEKAGNCRYCGDVTEKIPANGHDVTKWTNVKPASCTEPGIMQGECKICGDVAATKETEILPHTFDNSTVYWTSGIRCKENANGYYKCKDCDAKQDVVLLQVTCTSKNFKNTKVVTEATCTTKQTVIDICDYCKEPMAGTEKPSGTALGHDYAGSELTVTIPATCTADGLGKRECTRCGEIQTETVKALGHDYTGSEWTTTISATCTEAGLREGGCVRCGEIKTETIVALGHDFSGEWVTTTPATCTEAGLKELGCTRCDEIKTETIEALGHDFSGEWVTTAPATCTEAGLKELGCTRCDETQKERIEALGHDYTGSEWVTTAPATCTEAGLKELGCTRCDETQKETIEALGHDYTGSEWVTTTPATCTEAGLRECECIRCDETQKETIEALGHDYTGSEWVTTTPATCTATGLKELGCTRCDETQKETIAATGHTPGEWTEAGNGVCEESLLCAICSEVLDTRETEHTPVKMIIADSAVLNEDGHFVVQCRIACSVCGHTISEAEPVTRIAVNCNDESIKVVFDEFTEVTPGSDVYFTIEGAENASLFVMVTYDRDGSEQLEESDGIYSFTIPEDLAETETITIVVAKFA